jgi:hypothetical protein
MIDVHNLSHSGHLVETSISWDIHIRKLNQKRRRVFAAEDGACFYTGARSGPLMREGMPVASVRVGGSEQIIAGPDGVEASGWRPYRAGCGSFANSNASMQLQQQGLARCPCLR